MAVRLFYVDIRPEPPDMRKTWINWFDEMTAQQAVRFAFGDNIADSVLTDLAQDNMFLTVSWINPVLDDSSEIGGVGSLDWHIPDQTTLVINYEDATTTEVKQDQAMQWLLDNEHF